MAVESPLDPGLGVPAIPFNLPSANPWIATDPQESYALADFDDADLLVVVFTCNHCPYAIHVEDQLVQIANDYAPRVQFVAINSNNAAQYPEDSFEAMAIRAREKSFPFPYLYDETQEVAQKAGAVCTPDPFVYNRERRLVYRGRIDDTRPRQGTASHGTDLRNALDALLEGKEAPKQQFPAMGCSIKWK